AADGCLAYAAAAKATRFGTQFLSRASYAICTSIMASILGRLITARKARAVRRGLVAHRVQKGSAAQHVVILEFVHRQIFRRAAQRHVAGSGKETGDRQQAADMLLIVP